MNELALFAGAGGGLLGGKLLGWRTVCAVEVEPYPESVLCARQNDGILSPFPIWDDIRTFQGEPWRGVVDVVSGGFPCQDISSAGKGAGIEGERSGLWSDMFRVICEVRPRFVFVENSPMLASRGLGRVLGDLASVGYNAEWAVLGASDVGAPHIRKRIWILAYTDLSGREEQREPEPDAEEHASAQCGGEIWHPDREFRQETAGAERWGGANENSSGNVWWTPEPPVCGVAHGVAARVDRLRALGNGQVPAVAAMAFRILYKQLLGREYDPLCTPKERM